MMTGSSLDQDGSSTGALPGSGDRLVFVDVLRVAVIVLVVAFHAAQPYGPTGGDWPVTDPANSELLRPFFPWGAAFGMGLFFMLVGYFTPRSYDRKGARRFLKGRWMRIGVPLVLFMLVVHLPVVYLVESPRPSFGELVRSLYESGWQNVYLHLWFLGHVLLYSLAYAAWRSLVERYADRPPRTWSPPNHAAIVGFVVGLALVTFVVRGWYPIDEWVPLFFVVAAEPAHLPQYLSLFTLGVIAYRGDWLRRLPTRVGMVWLSVGLVASAGHWALLLLAPDSDVTAGGGFIWQSLLYSTWESVICAGMVVGLIVLFRQVFRRTNRVLVAMAAASYAAYIIHFMIVVFLQAGIEGLDLPALIKFGLVAILGVYLAFGIGHLSRRVPGLRMILGTTPTKPVEARRGEVSP
jgi:peptidoglycan/LPS O-acetylase OafA/YrhL